MGLAFLFLVKYSLWKPLIAPKCDAELMMPMMLEHFELKSKIAAGGMGTVYKLSLIHI